MRGVGVSFSTKTARVDYVPGATTILRLVDMIAATRKYRASLAVPVESLIKQDGATWTLRTEAPAYKPGARGRILLSRSNGMLPKLHATWRGDTGLTVAAAETRGNDTQVVAAAEFDVAPGLEAKELFIEVEVDGAAGPHGCLLRMTGVVPIRDDGVRRTGGLASPVAVDASRPDSLDLGMRIAIGLLVLAPLLLAARASPSKDAQ